MFKGNTEIKKLLYREKPTATLIGRGKGAEAYVHGFAERVSIYVGEFPAGDLFYEAKVDDIKVFFKVPVDEAYDEYNELILQEEEPAQLLIRYII